MATRSMKVVRGKRIRVTKVGACGEPPAYGDPCSYVVTSGFVTATLSAEIEEGEELTQLTADGDLCINDQSPHNFKRWTVELELCDVDPDLVSLLTKVTLETDANGDVVGYRSLEGKIDQNFAFELWSGIADQDCSDGEEYGYFLLPFVKGGTLGDIAIENGVTTFTIANAFTQKGSQWGVGPYDVVPDGSGDPAPLAVAIQDDEHHLQRLTTVAPPAVTDGCQPGI